MNQLKKYISSLFVLMVMFCNTTAAQSTAWLNDPDAEFKEAKAFFQQDNYSQAYPIFKKLYSNGIPASNIPITVFSECKYYYLLCGLILNDATAEPKAIEFIALEHNAPKVQMVSFHLGEYYYRAKKYADAISFYEQAGIDNLTNREIADMRFHQGYAHFTLQQFDKAKPLFNSIRQISTDPNYIDANYYYGFICFKDKEYDQSLNSFLIIEKTEDYKNIVPFYITELYYFKGDVKKASDYGEAALAKGNQYHDIDFKLLVGHLLFEQRLFAKALPYLAEYIAKTPKVKREDLYELAYCYYAAGNWNKAIEGFKDMGGKEDSLAQNSMYLLADAYLKTNQKANARNAFLFCATNNSNKIQKEISLLSYAKLSYELGFMDIAVKTVREYLSTYPSSAYLADARELEIAALAATSNYKDALQRFETIAVKTDNINKIYPRILYGRSVELINDQKLNEADSLLSKIIVLPYNQQQIQPAHFWKGEIAYRNGSLEDGIASFSKYLTNPQYNGEVNPTNAKYAIGYALMKKENYKAAQGFFDQIVTKATTNSTAIEQDAYIRLADCEFMNKSYKQAAKIYDDVIQQNLRSADYALYQKGIIAGATNKKNEKISLLQSLESNYPASSLIPDAHMEIANTYMADEQYGQALPSLQRIIKNAKANSLHPQAYLKTGICYFNTDQNEPALDNFKKLMVAYPNAPESDDAVEYVRNIFIEMQQPGEFANFMRKNGKNLSVNEEDSLTYRSAMLRYDARDFENAQNGFANYLKSFPAGRYSIEANYFAAECNIYFKKQTAALPFYTAVSDKAPNKYAERSALQAARILYFDIKNYEQAEKYFAILKSLATQQENKLEAMRGLLRCQFKTQKWQEASANATDILAEKGTATDDKMMANMILAKSYQLSNQRDMAINYYKATIALGKSEISAEAMYRVAEILLSQQKYAEAEKASFEVIKKMGSYEYWVTKSYLLLGDNYFAQKDWFNAEATYKSVFENGGIEELKQEAKTKLENTITEKNKSAKTDQ